MQLFLASISLLEESVEMGGYVDRIINMWTTYAKDWPMTINLIRVKMVRYKKSNNDSYVKMSKIINPLEN